MRFLLAAVAATAVLAVALLAQTLLDSAIGGWVAFGTIVFLAVVGWGAGAILDLFG
jgi:hypothetical protein